MAERSYRLTVEGELSDIVGASFDGMTVTRAGGNTSLTGKVRDQPELQGLLQRVSALGLVLLEARTIDDRSNPGRESGRTMGVHQTRSQDDDRSS
jgi:hypothetical protein